MLKLVRTLAAAAALATVFASSSAFAWAAPAHYRAKPARTVKAGERQVCHCKAESHSSHGAHFPAKHTCTHEA